MNHSRHLKKVLLNCIKKLAVDHREFLVDPDKNFTRSRKLDLQKLISFIICMEAGTTKDELYKFFGLSNDIPSASAFVQQRSKLTHQAFHFLFDSFNQNTIQHKSYNGFRLISVDGSTVPISSDPDDIETHSFNQGKDKKGFYAFHIHASYDLMLEYISYQLK